VHEQHLLLRPVVASLFLYRWDASGHPACPSLDGKTCWKTDPESCTDKLKKMKGMIASAKVKSVVGLHSLF